MEVNLVVAYLDRRNILEGTGECEDDGGSDGKGEGYWNEQCFVLKCYLLH